MEYLIWDIFGSIFNSMKRPIIALKWFQNEPILKLLLILNKCIDTERIHLDWHWVSNISIPATWWKEKEVLILNVFYTHNYHTIRKGIKNRQININGIFPTTHSLKVEKIVLKCFKSRRIKFEWNFLFTFIRTPPPPPILRSIPPTNVVQVGRY